MLKSNEKAKELFKKSSNKKEESFRESFEIQSQNANPISSFFNVQKLSPSDQKKIKLLVCDRYRVEGISDLQMKKDMSSLFELSSQIRAITKQSLILHGERIARGQNILKKYKRGAFTSWIDLAYGNRQTPYNFLYYYLLYKQLPIKTKELYQKIPYRAAYVLAARKGDIKEKIEIIENNFQKPQKDLLIIIGKTFPLSDSDRRVKVESMLSLTENILDQLKTIKARHGGKKKQVVKKLNEIKKFIEDIILDSV